MSTSPTPSPTPSTASNQSIRRTTSIRQPSPIQSRSSTPTGTASTVPSQLTPPPPSLLSSTAKLHAASTLTRSRSTSSAPSPPPHLLRRNSPLATSGRLGRSASVSVSTSAVMEAYPDLAKCSREQLVEMVGRGRTELGELLEKGAVGEEREERARRENDDLVKDCEAAKGRIDDLLNDQGRMEEELAGRIKVLDKLRTSVRELEREKRDADKRYRDQGDSFDHERQSWYDQESHYKLRISNLSTTNRKTRLSDGPPKPPSSTTAEDSSDEPSASDTPSRPPRRSRSPPPRSSTASPSPSTGPSLSEIALQDQLVSLTTAHSSLTSTMRTLQVELSELKRVYQDLQEENESYEILLGEKTLNGEVRGTDLFRRSSLWMEESGTSPRVLDMVEEDEHDDEGAEGEGSDEEEEDEEEEEMDVEAVLLETQGIGSKNSGAVSAGATEGTKRKRPVKSSGGGLDLAAELEAAQMVQEDEPEKKKKSKKKRTVADEEVVELKTELKQLKEANKALTLYVSKIVDRVCSQEGFEKVLAVDYRLATPKTGGVSPDPTTQPGYNPSQPPATTFRKYGQREPVTPGGTTSTTTTTSGGRRILGWDGISSLFSGVSGGGHRSTPSITNPAAAGLKPFVLGSDATTAPRKLEVEEDEDDLRERERLRAEMALHGLQDSGNKEWSEKQKQKRSSLSGRSTTSSTGGSPTLSVSGAGSQSRPVSAEILKKAEDTAALQIKAIEEKEKVAKIELGEGRASGFTEPKPRRIRPGSQRSSRSSSSRGGDGVGLGISDSNSTPGRTTPEGSPNLSSPATSASTGAVSPEVGVGAEEGDESWRKKLKRISVGWGSPNPTAGAGATSPNPASTSTPAATTTPVVPSSTS
ncbi:hypothetical protein P7C70_g7423, partial [Phenoliferia sp. Uapishka_3]